MRAIQVALGRPQPMDLLCGAVRRELARVMDTTGFVVGLYDDVSQMVEVVYQMDEGQEFPGGSFPIGHGFISEAIRNRQPRLIHHWSLEGPRVQVQYATDTPGLPEATITVPLLVGDRAIGVLSLQSHDVGAYDEDDLLLVQAVAAHLAPALDLRQRAGAVHVSRRASELEAVLSSMTEALIVIDPDGRIVRLNPPARAIFGLIGAGIVLGQRLDREQWGNWPLGAQAVAEVLGPVVDGLGRGESSRDREVEVNSDALRILSFSGAPIVDAAGRLCGGVVVFRDVTTQHEVARMKDELLAIASHDLRTPVTVVKCEAQLIQRALQRGVPDPEKLSQRVGLIVEQTDRLTRMLNQLLDLSRVEAGRMELALEPADLVELVRVVASGVQLLTTVHTIRLDMPAVLEGMWDAARIDQVLQNLLTNAVKYSPEGGTIVVRVESTATSAVLSVADPGLGIPTRTSRTSSNASIAHPPQPCERARIMVFTAPAAKG
jgi:PAS domain S-box-containing protein